MTNHTYEYIFQENSLLLRIAQITQEIGIEAYLVGGFVRDLLLKRPCKDLDIVCLGSGIDFANQLAERLNPELNVSLFKNFGTAMFHCEGCEIEIVGARKESYQRDSRKPIVENGTLEDDQNRRDFTINALAISLNKENLGALLDPFGGLEDLRKKNIRTPLNPDVTFSDDPLLILLQILLKPSSETKNVLKLFHKNVLLTNSTKSFSPTHLLMASNCCFTQVCCILSFPKW